MRKLLLASVVSPLLFCSCRHIEGSGNIVTQKKEVGAFTAISAGSGFDVEVKIGSPQSVEIETDDNLQDYVQVKVVGNTLRIHSKNGLSIMNGHMKALVTVPSLEDIESSGAANIKVQGTVKSADKIRLRASGGAKITAEVDAPEVDTESSGAASVNVSGRTQNVRAHASGGASIRAGELLSERANAEASGAANVHVYASVKLIAHASGAAGVYYKGEVTDITEDHSGAGKVEKEN